MTRLLLPGASLLCSSKHHFAKLISISAKKNLRTTAPTLEVSRNSTMDDDTASSRIEDCQFSAVGLRRDLMPKHVAMALDGNRRWFSARKQEVDYTIFFEKTMLFAQLCVKWGIGTATGFIWGFANATKRDQAARDFFYGQLHHFFVDNIENFRRDEIKVLVKGETSLLPESLQATIKKVEESTKNNSKLTWYLPTCYSAQRDITEATKSICEKVNQGIIEPQDVTEDLIQTHLSLCYSPPPDLFVRTGGDIRIGALLAWEITNLELYFTDLYPPEFGEDVFLDALRSFQQRTRLFGK